MYFPHPYPDELTSSLLIRASRHLGVPYGNLVKELLGTDRRRQQFVAPFALQAIARLTSFDCEELLFLHTLFPYVSAFMSEKQCSDVRSDLSSESANRRRDFKCIAGYRQNIPAFRRYCSKCRDEDFQLHGESYWHRVHVLPGTFVCPRHRLPLLMTDLPLTWCQFGLASVLPQDCSGRPIDPLAPQAILFEIAYASDDALNGRLSTPHPFRDFHALRAQKWDQQTSLNKISGRQLANWLTAFYGQPYLSATNATCSPLGGMAAQWPSLILRPDRIQNFPTFKHLLMRVFLENRDNTGDLE